MHPTPLNHSKHIRHILDQDSRGFGNGIDVLLAVIRHVGTGHEVQVFEGCVEAFTDAGVEIAERCVAVDEQDGGFGGGLGHGGEAVVRVIRRHKVRFYFR